MRKLVKLILASAAILLAGCSDSLNSAEESSVSAAGSTERSLEKVLSSFVDTDTYRVEYSQSHFVQTGSDESATVDFGNGEPVGSTFVDGDVSENIFYFDRLFPFVDESVEMVIWTKGDDVVVDTTQMEKLEAFGFEGIAKEELGVFYIDGSRPELQGSLVDSSGIVLPEDWKRTVSNLVNNMESIEEQKISEGKIFRGTLSYLDVIEYLDWSVETEWRNSGLVSSSEASEGTVEDYYKNAISSLDTEISVTVNDSNQISKIEIQADLGQVISEAITGNPFGLEESRLEQLKEDYPQPYKQEKMITYDFDYQEVKNVEMPDFNEIEDRTLEAIESRANPNPTFESKKSSVSEEGSQGGTQESSGLLDGVKAADDATLGHAGGCCS